jgi:hypothetical protein
MLGFHHHSVETLPAVTAADARIRVLAGSSYGQTSPVHTFSPLFYLDITLPTGSSLPLPKEYPEWAAYVIEGIMDCGFERAAAGRMLILLSIQKSHSAQIRLAGLFCSAAPLLMANATSGGTSFRARKSALSRPSVTGKKEGFPKCRATMSNSYRFRNDIYKDALIRRSEGSRVRLTHLKSGRYRGH